MVYFVSYYDYYQPEAYVPSSDTFIEKDASILSLIHIWLSLIPMKPTGRKRILSF